MTAVLQFNRSVVELAFENQPPVVLGLPADSVAVILNPAQGIRGLPGADGADGVDGLPGADGADGADGLPGDLSIVASEPLGGHRVITANGYHCSPANADFAVGITPGATDTGQVATIVSRGPMQEFSWTWTAGLPIFIGIAGVLTQVVPTSGIVRRVAFAISATLINVDFQPPITQA